MAELIYGRNPVFELLNSGLQLEKLFLAETGDSRQRELAALAKKGRIGIERVSKNRLTEIVGHEKHQGVAAMMVLPGFVTTEDMLALAKSRNEPPMIALLDGIEDPHNFGAILRSADGAGFHGVVITKKRSVGLTPTVIKTSAGAAMYVKIAQVTNLSRTIDVLKKQGIWLIGTDGAAQMNYTEVELTGPVGIVIGAEGKGLHRLVREKCDFLVKISMFGKIDSLNASVAAALLFFETRRQRAEA